MACWAAAVVELALLRFPGFRPGLDQSFLGGPQEGRAGGVLLHPSVELSPSLHVIGKRCVVHDSLLSLDPARLPARSARSTEREEALSKTP